MSNWRRSLPAPNLLYFKILAERKYRYTTKCLQPPFAAGSATGMCRSRRQRMIFYYFRAVGAIGSVSQVQWTRHVTQRTECGCALGQSNFVCLLSARLCLGYKGCAVFSPVHHLSLCTLFLFCFCCCWSFNFYYDQNEPEFYRSFAIPKTLIAISFL